VRNLLTSDNATANLFGHLFGNEGIGKEVINVKKQCGFQSVRRTVLIMLMIFSVLAVLAAVTVAQEEKAKKEGPKFGPLLSLLIKKGVVTADEYSSADAKFEPKPLPKESPVDTLGGPLTYLLIDKGIITQDELLAEIKDEIANKTEPFVPLSNLLMKKGTITEEERNALCKAWGIEVPTAKPTTMAGEKATSPTIEKKSASPEE
jgi:hypothetical protein